MDTYWTCSQKDCLGFSKQIPEPVLTNRIRIPNKKGVITTAFKTSD